MANAQVRTELHERGLRATASRIAVLCFVRESTRPVTHAEVADAFQDEAWDRATLYRNLTDLVGAGLLRRVLLGSTRHFEPSGREPHPHFVCTECGLVECAHTVHVPLQANDKAPRSVQSGNVEIQLHGVCDTCA